VVDERVHVLGRDSVVMGRRCGISEYKQVWLCDDAGGAIRKVFVQGVKTLIWFGDNVGRFSLQSAINIHKYRSVSNRNVRLAAHKKGVVRACFYEIVWYGHIDRIRLYLGAVVIGRTHPSDHYCGRARLTVVLGNIRASVRIQVCV
jgi:hypothetical protein